ncbi:hypothetical protein D3C76_1403110 [compost metagenome]
MSRDAETYPPGPSTYVPCYRTLLRAVVHGAGPERSVSGGDGIAAVSLYAVSPHDVVAGHALLRACGDGLWNEQGQAVGYTTCVEFNRPVRFCFGGGGRSVESW